MQSKLSKQAPNSGHNPYITDRPVGENYAFAGRTELINEVSNLLAKRDSNALFLYGQRRVGKTSLLQKLKAELASQQIYQPIYFDLEGKAALPLAQVLAELAFHLAQTVDLPPHTPWGAEAPRAFREEFLPAILRKLPANTTLVILFDEFDAASDLNDTQAGKALYPYFQKVLSYNLKQLQLVFALGRRPNDISSDALMKFKGSEMRPVPLLNLEETAQVINLSQYNGSLLWPYPAMIQAQSLSGGHPLITQHLCAQVWEQAYLSNPTARPEVQTEDVDLAIAKTLNRITKAMEWIWEGLTPAQRIVASLLAEADDDEQAPESLERQLKKRGVRVIVSELQRAPKELAQWGMIEKNKKSYQFLVKLQQRWLAEYKPWSLVKEEVDQIQPLAAALFVEASKLNEAGEFEKAIPKFRKAIRLNPNHLQANLLLAEALLVLGEVSEARHILEGLHQYYPGQAHPRLIQALLLDAQNAPNEDEQLAVYTQILQMEPGEPEAQAAYERIWEKRGDGARDAGKLDEALSAYDQAGLPGGAGKQQPSDATTAIPRIGQLRRKSGQVRAEIDAHHLAEENKRIERLKRAGKYQAALLVAQQLHHQYPTHQSVLPDLDELIRKAETETAYNNALDAILQNDRIAAQELLTKVIAAEPGYRRATHYLNELTTGVNIAVMQQEIDQERWAQQAGAAPPPGSQPAMPVGVPFYRQRERQYWLWIGGGVTVAVLLALCILMLGTSAAIGSFSLVAADPSATPTPALIAPSPRAAVALPTYTATPLSLADVLADGSQGGAGSQSGAGASNEGDGSIGLEGAPVGESPVAMPTSTATSPPTATSTPTSTPLPTNTPGPTATPEETATPETQNQGNSPVATPTTTAVAASAGSVAVFGNVLEMTGYKIQRIPSNPGNDLIVTTDWKLISATDMQLKLSIQMLTEIDGELLPSYGQKDYELKNSNKKWADQWSVGETLKNVKVIAPLSTGATNGKYFIGVVVYNQGTPSQDRLTVDPIKNLGLIGSEILVLQEFTIPN